jgi:protein KTI12
VYAEVKRVLSQGDIVVCDAAGGNYIKGWRYQLYCEAKAVRTPNCVVHVGTAVDKARAINEARLKRREELKNGEGGGVDLTMRADEEPYEPSTWENLVYRYEEPNGMVRWDSPLFTVLWDDETPTCDAIWDAMIGSADGKTKVIVRPNQATVLKPSSGEDYLYELDRATQEVLARIAEWTKDHAGEGGGEVLLGSDKVDGEEGERERLVVELPANRTVGLPALQRLRRQFIALNRQNAVSAARIKESFVGYLNDSFQAA